MNHSKHVQDDEELYRSVRGKLEDKEYSIQKGKLIIEPAAFQDRYKQPSVDRAKLIDYNPALSQKSKTDGIVSIRVGEVRAIGTVKTRIGNGDVDDHAVDVIPDPTCENPAHAKITVKPEFWGSKSKQKNAFKLLRIALAKLATKNGWTLEPSP